MRQIEKEYSKAQVPLTDNHIIHFHIVGLFDAALFSEEKNKDKNILYHSFLYLYILPIPQFWIKKNGFLHKHLTE